MKGTIKEIVLSQKFESDGQNIRTLVSFRRFIERQTNISRVTSNGAPFRSILRRCACPPTAYPPTVFPPTAGLLALRAFSSLQNSIPGTIQ